ncbi:MAG: hypothetical protein AAF497_18515, partial [Planctomycetota bacterium]
DAIADSIMDDLAEKTTKVKVEFKELMLKAKSEITQELAASSSGSEQKRQQEFLIAINEKLAELENGFVPGIKPPKVVGRTSGIDF